MYSRAIVRLQTEVHSQDSLKKLHLLDTFQAFVGSQRWITSAGPHSVLIFAVLTSSLLILIGFTKWSQPSRGAQVTSDRRVGRRKAARLMVPFGASSFKIWAAVQPFFCLFVCFFKLAAAYYVIVTQARDGGWVRLLTCLWNRQNLSLFTPFICQRLNQMLSSLKQFGWESF